MRAILSTLASAARHPLDDGWLGATGPGILERAGPHDALRETLSRWAESNPKLLVLLIDEIDARVGDTLLAVLRQLRAGCPERPWLFPQSVVLCGVREYPIRSGSKNAIVASNGALNIRSQVSAARRLLAGRSRVVAGTAHHVDRPAFRGEGTGSDPRVDPGTRRGWCTPWSTKAASATQRAGT